MRWLYVAAIWISLAGTAQAQTVGHSSGNSSATQSQAKRQTDAPPVIPLAARNDIQRIARALEAANNKPPSEIDKRNAEAQEIIAAWAPSLFWLGLVETLITLAGVILVWRTLIASREAAGHAKRAADAARDTVNSMEDTAKRQLGPMLLLMLLAETKTTSGLLSSR